MGSGRSKRGDLLSCCLHYQKSAAKVPPSWIPRWSIKTWVFPVPFVQAGFPTKYIWCLMSFFASLPPMRAASSHQKVANSRSISCNMSNPEVSAYLWFAQTHFTNIISYIPMVFQFKPLKCKFHGCRRCVNIDHSSLSLSLMCHPTLWRCDTKSVFKTGKSIFKH